MGFGLTMCRTADTNEQQSPSQWNETSGGGTAKATAALGELPYAALMLWLIIQLHECGKKFVSFLNRNINFLSSCFGTGNAITSIAIHVLSRYGT